MGGLGSYVNFSAASSAAAVCAFAAAGAVVEFYSSKDNDALLAAGVSNAAGIFVSPPLSCSSLPSRRHIRVKVLQQGFDFAEEAASLAAPAPAAAAAAKNGVFFIHATR